jgi:two-component system response regulator HydG
VYANEPGETLFLRWHDPRTRGLAMSDRNPTVLVVDDEEDTRELLADALRRRDYDVHALSSARDCLEFLQTHHADVVVTDHQMPDQSGTSLCGELRVRHPDLVSIVLTGVGNLETAIGAIQGGAYDFVTKPVRVDVLEVALRRALDHLALKREVKRLEGFTPDGVIEGLIGNSPAVGTMISTIRRVAQSDASVCITGESGTGKELVARAVHQLSARAGEPFVAINCAAMPPALLESELFGHVRGAFTDAKTARAGLFLQAGGGTIFLDEIGEMPLEMQVKLLRVLQERTVRPVGSDAEVRFEARVLTATHRDLETEIEQGRFREDLFYRINVVAIHVPALRDRGGNDVLAIARHVLAKIATRTHKPMAQLSQDAARKLVDYFWPGNVRELENCLERAVAVSSGSAIEVSALPAKVAEYKPTRIDLPLPAPDALMTLDEMERRYVRQVLESTRGNKTHAARVLGIDRRSLYRRLEDPTSSTASPGAPNAPTY